MYISMHITSGVDIVVKVLIYQGHSQDFSLGWAQIPFSEILVNVIWESTHSPPPPDESSGGRGGGTFPNYLNR